MRMKSPQIVEGYEFVLAKFSDKDPLSQPI